MANQKTSGDGQNGDIYPPPTWSSYSPYPALAGAENPRDSIHSTDDSEALPRFWDGSLLQPKTSSTVPVDLPDLQTLNSQYFERYGNNGQMPAWVFPGGSGRDHGAQSDSSPIDHELDVDDLDSHDVLEGQPKANAFLQPMKDMQAAENEDHDDASMNESGTDADEPSPRKRRGAGWTIGPRGGRVRRGGWRNMLKGTSHDPKLQAKLQRQREKAERKLTGRGRGQGRVRKHIDPGPTFKAALQKANRAYLEGDWEVAIQYAQEAVQQNPEVFQAHNLLSESLRCAGREQDSLAALMCGAHTVHDPKVWVMVAERTLDAAGNNRTDEDIDQALFCYSNAFLIKRDDVAAREGRLALYMDRKEWSKVRLEAKAVNRLNPYDPATKSMYADLAVKLGDATECVRAKQSYDEAFEYHMEHSDSFGDPDSQWSHLNIYFDLAERVTPLQECAKAMKRIARWFLGRKDEMFWDNYEDDDREFDSDQDRRGHVPEFQQGRASLDRSKYGDGLPIELRTKLGLLRLQQGMEYYSEAERHFQHVLALSAQVDEYYDLFFDVASGLSEAGLFNQAVHFYEPILKVPEVVTTKVLLGLAACYSVAGRYSEASELYLQIIDLDENETTARVQLAKVYDHMGQGTKALATANEATKVIQKNIMRDRIHDNDVVPPGGSRFDGRKRKSYSAGDRRHDIACAYESLKDSSAMMDEGSASSSDTDEWFQSAMHMIKCFRALDIFYPKHDSWKLIGLGRWEHAAAQSLREMEILRTRLEGTVSRPTQDAVDEEERDEDAPPKLHEAIPSDFHGIPFIEWHRIFVEMALFYARRGEQAACYELINEGMFKANVFFHSPELHNISMSTALSCGFTFNDNAYIVEISRKIINKGELRAGMSFQLLAALARLTPGPTAIGVSANQKFMLRAVKLQDGLALPPDVRNTKEYGNIGRTIRLHGDRMGDNLGVLDAGLLLHYGHHVSASAHSWSALPYFLRAFTLQPNSATTSLSLATIYLGNALKRQTDNRHYGISHAWGFFQRYYDGRMASGRKCDLQEAEFNRGRMWHVLGLVNLAIPCYEKALSLSAEVRQEAMENGKTGDEAEEEDFALEAAFVLRNQYALSGNMLAAQRITEQWLVI